MFKLITASLMLSLFSVQAMASTAGCTGTFQGKTLRFFAQGSLSNTSNGAGYVKINNREVARFEGAAANINYLARKFSIRNDRGDVVEGKLHNIVNGRSTLRLLSLPGEGVEVRNIPVNCWFKR